MPEAPLITVLIVARNRPVELRLTLNQLARQTYRPLELLVVDDASEDSLERVAKECWPEGRFVRNAQNLGLIASRSLGMNMAAGAYVCSLDDDSCFVQPDALERAVARMDAEKGIGVMTFFVHHSGKLPERMEAPPPERYVASYMGGGHMIRREVIEALGGYRDFYFYYGEEHEHALRVLDAGWGILYFPTVVVHHRVSAIGRQSGRIWGYSVRNNIWTAILLLPMPRVLVEVGWKIAVSLFDAVRLFQLKWLIWALASTVAGLPRVIRLRTPISLETARLYDYLRFVPGGAPSSVRGLLPRITWTQRWRWFFGTRAKRRRARSFWDRKPGGIGESSLATFSSDARSKPKGG
jgi:GT2 family glycosyltransferase